jgi:hypothetical protein
MELKTKFLIEELMNQVWEEIKEGFTSHGATIDKCFAKISAPKQQRDDLVTNLEVVATAFDSSFSMRKPEIKASLTYVKLELTKLNSLFECDAKNPSIARLGGSSQRPCAHLPNLASTALS